MASSDGGGEDVPRLSPLADVSMAALADLFGSEDTVLAEALRRVVNSAESSAQTISGWSSYVDDDTRG